MRASTPAIPDARGVWRVFWWRKKRERAEPERPSVGQELQIARKALARGDGRHAIAHLAPALDQEPGNPDALALLDQVVVSTPDPLALVPCDEPETPYPLVAVRAYVYWQRGDRDAALSAMAQVYRAVPGWPFWPWVEDWLTAAVGAEPAGPTAVAAVVSTLGHKLKGGAPEAQREALERLLLALRDHQRAHADVPLLALALSILVRELGHVDEALAIATEAHQRAPTYFTAVALAGARRAQGRFALALDAFQDALQRNPDDLSARLDRGDLLCEIGQPEAGLAAYQDVLDRDPEQSWAVPSSLYYRHLLHPTGPWRRQLDEYAAAHPANARAQELARQPQPWVAALPAPGEAILNSLRQIMAQGLEVREAAVTSLEAPSAVLAVRQYMLETFGHADFALTVAELQRPDPRFAHGIYEWVLWRYQGTDPRPAFDPPDPAVAAAVAGLAARPFDAGVWSHLARQVTPDLGPPPLDALLAAMVNPPPRPTEYTIWDWIQRVQVASAFLIARLDDGWEDSLRRRALLSLARGPLDWSVGAAIIALGQLALEEPAARAEIDALYVELLSLLPRPGAVPYDWALATWARRLPLPSPELRQRTDRLLAEMVLANAAPEPWARKGR
jgi:tetratricopeptide (TPR) repeat protein